MSQEGDLAGVGKKGGMDTYKTMDVHYSPRVAEK